jgi:hypothetical protein
LRNRDVKSFSIWDTNLSVRFNGEISHPTLLKIFDTMRNRGFYVGSNPRIDKDYACLSKDNFAGNKAELRFEADKYPAGFKLEFYQEVNTINRYGGRYDFNKFKMMPYLIKMRFLVEIKYIKELLVAEGYEDQSDVIPKTAYEKVMKELHSPDRHWNSDNLPNYNALDKDKKRLSNEEIKYFRDRKGVLMRGTVYHNINNMWWVVVNKDYYTNLASFELFDLDSIPENSVRKLVKRSGHHNPKSRFKPSVEQLIVWKSASKEFGKEGRIKSANEILSYLYKINWLSRNFQFVSKETGRLGLVETEGNPYFMGERIGERKFATPKPIPLYPKPRQMSSTESGWIESIREYVVHGKPSVSNWFCEDRNGEGGAAYLWPEVRMKLLEIGAMSG